MPSLVKGPGTFYGLPCLTWWTRWSQLFRWIPATACFYTGHSRVYVPSLLRRSCQWATKAESALTRRREAGNPGLLDRCLYKIQSVIFGGCRMKRLSVLFMALALVLFLLPGGSLAEEGNLKEGKTLYLKHCKICHGQEGKGDGYALFNPPVADLTASTIQKKPDKELWESIHMGVSNTSMGMWRFVLSDEEITLVLGYVRSLATGS